MAGAVGINRHRFRMVLYTKSSLKTSTVNSRLTLSVICNSNKSYYGRWFEHRGISYLFSRWSSRWGKSWERLLLVPDISTSWVVVIFESSKDDLTLHLSLKTTTALEVKTSVTNNSLSKDYLHLDDHTKKISYYANYTRDRVEWPLRNEA